MTPEELELLRSGIRASGFPFELEVGSLFISLGYKTRLSAFFFDSDREKDTEIDILASRQIEFTTPKGRRVQGICRIAVECKDARDYYVCFGLESEPQRQDEHMIGEEVFAPQIRTSRDSGIRNRFNVVLFHPRGSETPRRIDHHHFAEGTRFHSLAAARVKGEGPQRRYEVSTPARSGMPWQSSAPTWVSRMQRQTS